MRIRLRDVATLAGVSEATVSRVMNRKEGVSDRTRERVVRVLAELGYAPEALHPTPAVGVVGLIVPELDNPIFPKFVQSVEARLLSSGYLCVLCCATRVGATEDDYLGSLIDRRVAGVIVVSGRHADVRADHTIYDEITDRGIALVCVNGSMEESGIASVSTDDRAATATAYRHLRSLGHERIGLLIGPRCYTPVLRKIEGFEAAATEAGAGADLDELVAETIFSLDGGFSGAQRLLDLGVTGIVAASDMMALGAIRAARERGLAVPDDLSVVGFDDTELMRFTDPPLTTVHQPVTRIVEHAVSVLFAQIEGQPYDRAERLLAGELIVRGTTAVSPALRAAPIG
ncbi:MAG TPA: LacI family DNA-binding transcriptional regulator [Ilumatobacteraceae bacterium]|nr:LacI family DNA-binding transcriptional regulator [Ilumatobacteraceae bacterium]